MKLTSFRFNYIYFLIPLLILVFFSCHSTSKLEKRQSVAVYDKLGIKKDRKDNFELYKEAAEWLHVPQRDGGMSKSGIDCSGLVCVIYKNVYDKTLERNSQNIYLRNCKKKTKKSLKEGDLVFFKTTLKSNAAINHVGIYLKDDKFVHTSTSKGVIVSNLSEDYYRKSWVCGGRVK